MPGIHEGDAYNGQGAVGVSVSRKHTIGGGDSSRIAYIDKHYKCRFCFGQTPVIVGRLDMSAQMDYRLSGKKGEVFPLIVGLRGKKDQGCLYGFAVRTPGIAQQGTGEGLPLTTHLHFKMFFLNRPLANGKLFNVDFRTNASQLLPYVISGLLLANRTGQANTNVFGERDYMTFKLLL